MPGSQSGFCYRTRRLRQQGRSLQAEERVRFGLDLADMMFADRLPDRAFETLREILPDVDSGEVGPERRHQFWELQARCLQALGPYVDTRPALERAMSRLCAIHPSTHERFACQLGARQGLNNG